MTKPTQSGYIVKIECFIAADVNVPSSIADGVEEIGFLHDRLAPIFSDIEIKTRYVHRRAVKAEKLGGTS